MFLKKTLSMKLRLVDPPRIAEFENQVTRIGNSVNDLTLFERISKACLNQRAFLFVSKDVFFVLKPMAGKRLLVWVAYSKTAVDRFSYLYELEQFARDIEADHLVFWSNRKGFHKIAKNLGFTPIESEWMDRPITIWSKRLTTE